MLIFDSGVGSLSIGAAIHQLIPQANLLYAMDHGGFPYGEWQEDALVAHICQTVSALLQQHKADIVVMA
ncbi:MAG: glutamate racemase, partial [Gammaproteobacteria bacterium]|nr:glutamate racemase [Gammaproteobacteria bacterium]MBU1833955.1 glutamate racemase [Gammaproteobacteria bacterium]